MIIWTLLVSNISKIGMGIFGVVGLFLYGKNSKLTQENAKLQQDLKVNDQIIDIQNKVIDAAQNTKPTDLDGNLERMHKDKL